MELRETAAALRATAAGRTLGPGSRAAAGLVVLLASWPTGPWFVRRLSDGSDEPLGVVALAVAALLWPWRAVKEPLSPRRLTLAIALLAAKAGAIAAGVALPLLQAGLSALALAVALAPRERGLALAGLLVTALPLLATLQFYLGYPLRVATTWLAAEGLSLAGRAVSAEGTVLVWAGERVAVDPPCSGLAMAWTGSLACFSLAAWRRLPNRATLALARRTGLAVFAANVLRAAFLFLLETRPAPPPAWLHEAVGLVCFSLALTALLPALAKPTPSP